MKQDQVKKQGYNILIIILILITVAAVSVTAWTLLSQKKANTNELIPDYASQKEEPNAESIPDDSNEKMENPEGGGSVSLVYSREVSISLSNKIAELLFMNPGKSNQDIILQIVIQDVVIAQSGILKAGNQITELELMSEMVEKLSDGIYEGNFNVLYYDPETGEKAIVNTEIPVTITVTNDVTSKRNDINNLRKEDML